MATNVKSLNDFYNELKTVGVRLKNQFQMTITTGDASIDKIFENIVMYAKSAALPGREQETVPLAYMGYEFQVPTRMKMTQTMSMTVRADSDMALRNAFLKWMGKISNPDILGGSNGQGDKRLPAGGSVRLRLMDNKFEDVISTYLLSGAFPNKVGDVDLSNESAEVAEFEVGLTFQFWSIEEENTGKVPGVK